jgi:hypothetical protein
MYLDEKGVTSYIGNRLIFYSLFVATDKNVVSRTTHVGYRIRVASAAYL